MAPYCLDTIITHQHADSAGTVCTPITGHTVGQQTEREIGGVTVARAAPLAPTRGVLTFRQGQWDSHRIANQSIETELTKKKKNRKKKSEI